MYPNLSYLLHDLIGTAPDNWTSVFQTFGLFMALAFLAAAWNLNAELRRKEAMGLLLPTEQKIMVGKPVNPLDVIFNGLLGFFVGFKLLYIVQNFEEFKAGAPDLIFSSKGNILGGIIGALLFAGYKYWEKSSERLDKPIQKVVKIFPSDRTGDITVVAAITGLFGAKIFALIETPTQFMQDPIGQLFSGSGLAIYGGLIGGAIGVIAYIAWKKISVPHFADAVAPGLMLSYGVGRIGCQMAGDGDWGVPVKGPNKFFDYAYDWSTPPSWLSWLPDWFWSFDYPHNVNGDGGPTHATVANCTWKYCARLDVPVFPTALWEVIAAFLLFGILWSIRKKITTPGVLFSIYLVLNGMERYWIEGWRVNDRYDWLPFRWTQAELIAVIMMVGGLGMGLFLWNKNKKKTVA
ncbi:MAG TPA: hypothetical protein ENJ53_04590 [Phaeodactylibacter sp.]|nr:hypothetical protein [Phaeodactylibacter sp.]